VVEENSKQITTASWGGGVNSTAFVCGFLERGLGVDAITFADTKGEKPETYKYEDKKYIYWYPLIEWGWYREDCLDAIKRHGLPIPPKSACFFCPGSKKHEVVQLMDNHPDLLQRALDMENRAKNAGNLHVIKGLGRSWSWQEFVTMTQAERDKLADPPQIACMCFDGEDDED
jgi:hypothetical protein